MFLVGIMSEKIFKTIDEQIGILRERGLRIDDEAKAKDFLLHNNYYRISGYSLTLRKNDIFSKSASFQNIVDIYNFDHELRHIILKYIEIIEVEFKSIYAYEFTKVFGSTGRNSLYEEINDFRLFPCNFFGSKGDNFTRSDEGKSNILRLQVSKLMRFFLKFDADNDVAVIGIGKG